MAKTLAAARFTEEERFWGKIEEAQSGCWTWTASKVDGYGQFFPSHGVRVRAHRYAYERMVGAIPAGLDLDHLCRNRACVNPEHLEPVTRRVNLLRGATVSAAASKRTHCPRGHRYDAQNTVIRQGARRCRACELAKATEAYRAAHPDGKPPPSARTHCPAGHAYDESNTYTDPQGHRHCRACRRERIRAWRQKRKATE